MAFFVLLCASKELFYVVFLNGKPRRHTFRGYTYTKNAIAKVAGPLPRTASDGMLLRSRDAKPDRKEETARRKPARSYWIAAGAGNRPGLSRIVRLSAEISSGRIGRPK